jgi:hypothetical protein
MRKRRLLFTTAFPALAVVYALTPVVWPLSDPSPECLERIVPGETTVGEASKMLRADGFVQTFTHEPGSRDSFCYQNESGDGSAVLVVYHPSNKEWLVSDRCYFPPTSAFARARRWLTHHFGTSP